MDLMAQEDLLIAAIAGGVLVLLVLIVLAIRRGRERRALRAQFGPEYARTVEARGSKRKAVRDLKERQRLRSEIELRELNEADRRLVARSMAALQYRFVEDPADTMLSVARITAEVLRAQGYPAPEDLERALRLFSVDHPEHAGALRRALEGEHHTRIDRMRETFLGVRNAFDDVAGVQYDAADAAAAYQEMGVGSEATTVVLPSSYETRRLADPPAEDTQRLTSPGFDDTQRLPG